MQSGSALKHDCWTPIRHPEHKYNIYIPNYKQTE
jgi:hypothetical protein